MNFLRLLPRFRQVPSQLATMLERESWTRNQIQTWQLAQLNRIWSGAIRHVPYYHRLFANGDLPREFKDVRAFQRHVPVLAKALVRSSPQDFISQRAGQGRWRVTGGSTGQPTKIFWSQAAHQQNLLTRYRYLQAWGVDYLHRQLMLWGPLAKSYPPEQKTWAFGEQYLSDCLRGRLRITPQELNEIHPRCLANRIRKFAPSMIYGFSSAVYQFAERMEGLHWNRDALRLCIITGEPANPEQNKRTEACLGVPVIMEYGSMDCGIIAYENIDRTHRIREDHFFVETELRPDGRHDLLVTSLINSDFPLLRYRIEDVVSEPPCLNADGFAIMPALVGRSTPVICSKSASAC